MAEVLDLCLSELPNAQQPGAGSDLISVRLADLSSCKWQFPAVVVEEILEIHEDALSGFGPQEADHVAGGPNGRPEHEVEGERDRRDVVAGVGSSDIPCLQCGPQRFFFKLPHRGQQRARLLHSLLGQLQLRAVGERGLQRVFQQVIGTVTLVGLQVAHHQVRETVHVPAGLQHRQGGHCGALHLEHAFFQDEVLPPQCSHVLLDSTTRRTIVVKPCHAAVDLEGRNIE
mmetsp:Transcript_11248/g.33777  ORF Transcript_11248/g.33777 Transcript_11248/m.33777 type:complete len:229 (-) Transcript_11248:449-1135(-)